MIRSGSEPTNSEQASTSWCKQPRSRKPHQTVAFSAVLHKNQAREASALQSRWGIVMHIKCFVEVFPSLNTMFKISEDRNKEPRIHFEKPPPSFFSPECLSTPQSSQSPTSGSDIPQQGLGVPGKTAHEQLAPLLSLKAAPAWLDS